MEGREKEVEKTYEVRFSLNASQNFNAIKDYIAYSRHEPLNSIRLGDALLKTFKKIRSNPFAFAECRELATKRKIYRRVVCFSWSIVYRIMYPEILILGIIHHSQKSSTYKSLRKIK
jgi:plasmid stabilization system protein ParE